MLKYDAQCFLICTCTYTVTSYIYSLQMTEYVQAITLIKKPLVVCLLLTGYCLNDSLKFSNLVIYKL